MAETWQLKVLYSGKFLRKFPAIRYTVKWGILSTDAYFQNQQPDWVLNFMEC